MMTMKKMKKSNFRIMKMNALFAVIVLTAFTFFTSRSLAFIDPNVGLEAIRTSKDCIGATPDYAYAMTQDAFGTDDKGPILVVKNNCTASLRINFIGAAEDEKIKNSRIKFAPHPYVHAIYFYEAGGKDDCDLSKITAQQPAHEYSCHQIIIPPGYSAGFNFKYNVHAIIKGQLGEEDISIEGTLTDKLGIISPGMRGKNGPQ
jgi:hypothetical protein